MATLHERAIALSESWKISYKEALQMEREFDQQKISLGLKTKEAPTPPADFWAWLMPGANTQPVQPASFGEFLGF